LIYTLKFKRSVQGDLKRVGREAAKIVLDAIRKDLLTNPRAGKRLKGKEGVMWNYRVGSYRIIYTFGDEELVLLVVRVGHRKEVYRGI
jgi:mRNA interferase RelE/StbE